MWTLTDEQHADAASVQCALGIGGAPRSLISGPRRRAFERERRVDRVRFVLGDGVREAETRTGDRLEAAVTPPAIDEQSSSMGVLAMIGLPSMVMSMMPAQ